MLDVKSAYAPNTPASPQGLAAALVQLVRKVDGKTVYGDLVEMHVFGKWYEGKRIRYNLVQFGPNNTLKRVLRGCDGEYVALQ